MIISAVWLEAELSKVGPTLLKVVSSLTYPLTIQSCSLCIILFSYSLFPFRKLLEMEVPGIRYLASCKAIGETSEAMDAHGELE